MHPLSKLWAVAALFSCTGALARQTELVLSNAIVQPDGFSRPAIVVNGTIPGPPIIAEMGEHLEINVINQLTDRQMNTSTSVHWHGIYQHHMNSFDGTAFVTQCPLTPGDSYLYRLNIQNQSGTYWYHSHYDLQYCDGLRGPIVIYDPQDPYRDLYDVDDISTIISVYDWYHLLAYDVTAPDNPTGMLINGLGRYPGGPNTTLSVTTVEQGKRYRLRVISMSCKPHFYFWIEGHSLTVIEADGRAVLPFSTKRLPIYPAQRYSLILEANQTVGNYWIRAMPGSFVSNFTDGLNSAILRYVGAPDQEPHILNHTTAPMLNETDLHARDNPKVPGLPYPGGADVSLNLVWTENNVTLDYFIGVNGTSYSYTPPDTPTLLQILSGTAGIASLAQQGTVFTLPPNKVIEVTFPTTFLTTPHPFHLHGHSFYVVRSAGSTVYNYVNPVQRDTVNIGLNDGITSDNVTIRFITDNSGPWFVHCHIDWHLQRGMAVVFAENPSGVAAADPVDDSWKNLCPTFDAGVGNRSIY